MQLRDFHDPSENEELVLIANSIAADAVCLLPKEMQAKAELVKGAHHAATLLAASLRKTVPQGR